MGAGRQKPPSGTPPSLIRELCKNNARVEVVDFLFQAVISEDAEESTMSVRRNEIRKNCFISEGGLTNLMNDLQDYGMIIQDEIQEEDVEEESNSEYQSNIEYRVTESGNVIFEDYFNLLDKCETMADEDLQQFLNAIPNWDEVLCDVELLGDATVKTSSRVRANEARREYTELVSNSTTIRELVPQLFFPEEFDGGEKDLDFIVNEETMELVPDEDLIEDADYWVVDRDVPYTLSVFDEKIVGIIPPMEDDPNMFLYTDNGDVLDWAQQQYDDFLGDAEPYR